MVYALKFSFPFLEVCRFVQKFAALCDPAGNNLNHLLKGDCRISEQPAHFRGIAEQRSFLFLVCKDRLLAKDLSKFDGKLTDGKFLRSCNVEDLCRYAAVV